VKWDQVLLHEVNQPLAAIANYTQACLRFIGVENPDLDKLGDILFKIHQQALKAGQIIHRMKDFVSARKIHRILPKLMPWWRMPSACAPMILNKTI